ncbi:hypothetical protein HPB48_002390 [Haemaphysalis longicornis]|uniref:Fibrinogen C-terminal domain-containing protein n=1 Tax=Haemaphysalis longicornis TaxID=44386 RepID=A0A9J6GZM3_HAELO|nr:hypothetical protein HPB48_002390 [Haemaphysalis longicornis]
MLKVDCVFLIFFCQLSDQDGLSEMNGRKFSTFDRNSSPGINCAALNRGAWWFKDCNGSNLNGVNFNGEHFYPGNGIQWKGRGIFGVSDWRKYSYPSVRMMIRPAGGLKDTSTRQRFPARIREPNFKLERKHRITKTRKLGK